MSTRVENALAAEIQSLDRDAWNKIQGPLMGCFGEDKFPLFVTGDDWVQLAATDATTKEEAAVATQSATKAYVKANSRIHDVLCVVFRNVPEATMRYLSTAKVVLPSSLAAACVPVPIPENK